MKKIALLLLMFTSISLYSQTIVKGSGVVYTNGAPTHSVNNNADSELAIDTTTGFWYEHSRDGLNWVLAGFRIQKFLFSVAPTAAPLDKQSEVLLNNVDSLYRWRAGAWHHINPGAAYTAGTGINITGLVITNTAPDQVVVLTNGGGITITGTYPNFTLTAADPSPTNELQTIANTSNATSHTVTLSNSGGSIQYVEGTGIGLATTGTGLNGVLTITNSSPDQTVALTAGSGISITGTYPNFTITNSSPDVTVTFINGGGISITGTYPNFTLTASDQSASNEGSLTVVTGGANDSQIHSNTSGSSDIILSGLRGLLITESGQTITLAMPTGTQHYTMRYDGTNWVSSAELQNNDTEVGIGAAPIAGIELYVNGRGRFDATIETRGTGVPNVTTSASALRMINTTAVTGDTWYFGSMNDGTLVLQSGNANTVLTGEADGTIATTYDFKIGDVTGITPNTVIGRDASGYVGTVGIGSGLSLSAGVLSATGGGGGSTDLTFTGASSPVTLNSSTGTDVIFTAGTSISFSQGSNNLTINNTAPDVTVTLTNGGGIAISGTYPNFTLTATDASISNEGILGVGAGGATSSTITTNTTTGNAVTINVSTGLSISESTSANGGSITLTNSSPDQVVTLTNGGGITITGSYPNFTLTAGVTTAYSTIQEEGVGLTQRSILNFVGSSFTASDNVTKTDVTADSDLNALASTATTGLYIITGVGTSTTRTLIAPAAGISVTNGNGVSGNPTLALVNDLLALENLAATGIAVRTAADTWAQRSVVAGTGAITISNGDGVAGNITVNNTDPDQSTSNEIQVLSASGASSPYAINLSIGGGTIGIIQGTNMTITRSGNDFTFASTGGGGGTPAGANYQVQYYDTGAFGADASFNYNPTSNRLVVGHTTATAVLHGRGANDVSDNVVLAENFSGNDVLGIYATGNTKWGDNETWPYVHQTPTAGGTTSYTSNGLTFESSLVATTGVDLFSFNHASNNNSTGGPYSIVKSTGTWAPTSGSAIYNSITASPTINVTSTATGKANMFSGTPTITQATGGVNIFNAAPTVTAVSGGLRGYYSDIASGSGIYQLYMDGTAQSRFDGQVGIGADPILGHSLYTTSTIRADNSIEARGTGIPMGGGGAAFRAVNTTGGTGDQWYFGSQDNGTGVIQSGNAATVLTFQTDGTVQAMYDLEIDLLTGTPTKVIGTDAGGQVGQVILGSDVVLASGELPLWNSTDAGALTTLSATALANVTGMTFAVTNTKKYEFWATVKYSAAATATGSAWSMDCPTGTIQMQVESGLTNNTTFTHWQNAENTLLASATSAYTTGNIAFVRGIYECTASGTCQLRGATETAASNVTVQGVSNINWREIK